MHRPNALRTLARAAALGGLAALAPLLGCYQRVTSAKGIGTEEYTVYESAEEGALIPLKQDEKVSPQRRLR